MGLDTPVILVAEDSEALEESRIRLARVGMEKVIGALAGGFPAWHAAGFPAAETPQISVENLRQELGNLRVIDVRRPAEYEDAHIEGALLLPLNRLAESLGDLDRAQPCAVHCKSGYRSAIAASILERAGFRNVLNVTGGFDAWRISGFPCAGAQAAPACSAAG
jgi:hydroxyacylglutathione hydrolase